MFGYLSAASNLLTAEESDRYKACYCGLCRTLQKRYGFFPRTALSFDITFLILLLSSLYDHESYSGENGCLLHPFSKKAWWCSPFTEYAADVNVLLAYYKARDNWEDERKLFSLGYSELLSNAFHKAEDQLGDTAVFVREKMEDLRQIENCSDSGIDSAAACFGEIMKRVFTIRDDRWTRDLQHLAFHLGQFIYVMDASIDLEEDVRSGHYNPFSYRSGMTENRNYFIELLKNLMGDVLYAMDRLPLLDDSGILSNILCFGVWEKFNRKYPLQAGEAK